MTEKKLGIILAIGEKNDRAVNQYIREDILSLKNSLENQVKILHPLFPKKSIYGIIKCIRYFVARKCDYILGVGIYMKRAFEKFLIENPDVRIKLGVIDLEREFAEPRVASLRFSEKLLSEPAGFIAAHIASKLCAEDLSVMFLGGVKIRVVRFWAEGFLSGVVKYNKFSNIRVNAYVDYLGKGSEGFRDYFAAFHDANYHFKWKNATIIMQACGGSCAGVLDAAGTNKFIICCDYAKWLDYGNKVIFSVIRDIGSMIKYWIIENNENQYDIDILMGSGHEGPGWENLLNKIGGDNIIKIDFLQTWDKAKEVCYAHD